MLLTLEVIATVMESLSLTTVIAPGHVGDRPGHSGLIRSELVTPAGIIWPGPVIKIRFGHIVNTPDLRENMANMLI